MLAHLQEVISHPNKETLSFLGGYDETFNSPKPNHQRFEFRLQRVHDLCEEIPSKLTFAVKMVEKTLENISQS